jgi:hypothetical protein
MIKNSKKREQYLRSNVMWWRKSLTCMAYFSTPAGDLEKRPPDCTKTYLSDRVELTAEYLYIIIIATYYHYLYMDIKRNSWGV